MNMCRSQTMTAPRPVKRFRRNFSVDLAWGLTMLVVLSLMLNGTVHFRQRVERLGEAFVAANATLPFRRLRHRAEASSPSDDRDVLFSLDSIDSGSKTGASEEEALAAEEALMDSTGTVPNGVNPQALSQEETMSACLLLRDDNDILNEWIAYHYHVLKLRRLIVAMDPTSMTSPATLLKNWRDQDMSIDLWNDEDYMPEPFRDTGLPPKEFIENITKFKDITYKEMMQVNSHRYRQRVFLSSCFRKIKNEGRTWAMHIDSDEFVISNKLLREQRNTDVPLVPIEEPGSVLDLLQQVVQRDPAILSYPCVSMPRTLYGSIESLEEDWPSPNHKSFDRLKFETLRWRYHASPLKRKAHGNPKVIVDVSKIPPRFLKRQVVSSIHRPYLSFCKGHREVTSTNVEEFPLIANHYLGSWKRYSARKDSRRSWETYTAKANVTAGTDDGLHDWLNGFIADVGLERASSLLGDAYLSSDASDFVAVS